MYKTIFLLLLLAVMAVFSFALVMKNEKLEVSTPVLSGSPILVLNQ